MISATIVGDRELIARIGAMPRVVHDELVTEVRRLGFKLQALVQTNYLTGQVLKVRTGRLKSSITQGAKDSRSRFSDSGTEILYYVGTNVEYAAIHEYGGVIKHPGGTAYIPQPGGAWWVRNDNPLAAKLPRTKAHDITMPKRPYLAPALASMKQEIIDGMQAALKRGMEKALKQ